MKSTSGRGGRRWWTLIAVAAAAAACREPAPAAQAEDFACNEVAAVAERLAGAQLERRHGAYPGFREGVTLDGCVVEVDGPLTPQQPVPVLVTTFVDSLGFPWVRDDTLVADGPAMTSYGLWRRDVLCLVRVDWGAEPAAPDLPRVAGESYHATVGCAPRAAEEGSAGGV